MSDSKNINRPNLSARWPVKPPTVFSPTNLRALLAFTAADPSEVWGDEEDDQDPTTREAGSGWNCGA